MTSCLNKRVARSALYYITPFGEINLVKRKDNPGQKKMSVGQEGVVVP